MSFTSGFAGAARHRCPGTARRVPGDACPMQREGRHCLNLTRRLLPRSGASLRHLISLTPWPIEMFRIPLKLCPITCPIRRLRTPLLGASMPAMAPEGRIARNRFMPPLPHPASEPANRRGPETEFECFASHSRHIGNPISFGKLLFAEPQVVSPDLRRFQEPRRNTQFLRGYLLGTPGRFAHLLRRSLGAHPQVAPLEPTRMG